MYKSTFYEMYKMHTAPHTHPTHRNYISGWLEKGRGGGGGRVISAPFLRIKETERPSMGAIPHWTPTRGEERRQGRYSSSARGGKDSGALQEGVRIQELCKRREGSRSSARGRKDPGILQEGRRTQELCKRGEGSRSSARGE
jgi:hypothetical protein